MNKDPKFQERWEFRKRDDEFNSSSDDSKSSSSFDARRKKQNLLSRVILSQCLESNDDLRSQERNQLDSNLDANFRFMEGTEKHIGSSNCCKAIKNIKRRDPVKHSPKKQKSSTMESALWDDLKTFRESVVGELKVARETMFTLMKDDMTKLNSQKSASMPQRKVQNTFKRQSKNKSESCRRNHSRSNKSAVMKKKMGLDSTNCSTICIEQVSHDQTLKAVASCKDNGNRSVISLKKPICLVNNSEHAVSASYPALPTVLTKALVENLNNMVPLRDQIQPTVVTTDRDSIIQKESLGINANNHIGYILGSPEGSSGSFAHINSKSLCLYDQSSMNMAFQVPPLQMLYNASNISSQAIPENTLQGHNRLLLGTNSGTLSFSGRNLALAECFIANSLGNHMAYRRNRGLVSFRCQNYKEDHPLQSSLEKD